MMRIAIRVLCVISALLFSAAVNAAFSANGETGTDTSEVRTMVHRGHPVKSYAISYDEKYLFTRGEAEICVWDMRNLMLVKTLPITTSYIYAHPADSHLIYVRIKDRDGAYTNDEAYYAIVDWCEETTVGFVSPSQVPSRSASADMDIARYGNDMLVLVPMTENPRVAGYLGGMNVNIGSVCVNDNDSLLLTSGMIPQVWDLRHASIVGNIPYYRYLQPGVNVNMSNLHKTPYKRGQSPSTATFCNSYFVPGTDDVILGGVRDTVSIWHIGADGSGSLLSEVPVGVGPSPSLAFLGDTIIAATKKGVFRSVGRKPFAELEAFRLASGRDEFNVVSRPYGNGHFLAGSCDGRKGMASLIEGSFHSATPTRVADKAYGWIRDIKIAPREDFAVVAYGMNGIARVDLAGDTLRYGPKLQADWLDNEKITACEILPNETVVGATSLGALNFWKKGSDSSYLQKHYHHASINSIALSPDSGRMYTSDRAGQITIWDTATLEPIMYIYQVIDLAEPAYIFLTPDHYYKATPNAHKFINFVKDGQPYSFEQFDLRNNRPDIILSRLGGDIEEIDLLHRAWQKRLRRAGIDEMSLSDDYHVPESSITNRNRIPAVTADNSVILDMDFYDTTHNLSEISVSLNGVPILPSDKRQAFGRKHSITLPIALASGNNEIVVSCRNEKGAQSLKEVVNVTRVAPINQKPELYVIAIGVSNYADSQFNLNYAGKDARDFSSLMQSATSGSFSSVHQLLLTDTDFSSTGTDRIKDFLAPSQRDDVVILFYAGHGVLDANLDYYLATSAMDFTNPKNGGIVYDDFIGLLDGIGSVNRYCFIDACHSGELDKEDYVAVNTVEMPEGEELVFRAAGHGIEAASEIDRINAVLSDMFLDLRWGVGATVLSSAGAAELAVESSKWKNGLFTYCLRKGLESTDADTDGNGSVSLKEWIDFTSQKVVELSEGRQSPTLRSHNYHNDLQIK